MTSAWSWAGASATGTAHLSCGAPCQDAFACLVWRAPCGAGVLIAALADGAGSAPRAGTGAVLATSVFAAAVYESLAEGAASMGDAAPLMRFAAEQARFAIAALAAHERRDIGDFASTFLGAILHGGGGAVAQIGDGGVVAAGVPGRSWQPLLWPDHGEYANTTRFLTDPDALAQFRVEELAHPVANVCLFSDGLERLVLDFRERTAHAPFFDRIFRDLPGDRPQGHAYAVSHALAALLSSEIVNSRTDDDKSILCATLRRPVDAAQDAAQS